MALQGTPGGANRGRGEDYVADQLRRRGHAADQQRMVWRNDQVGRYYIDITIGEHVALELYSYWREPWLNEGVALRLHNLVLEGWHVLYVWLKGDEYPSDAAIDACLQFAIDTHAGSQHSFRTVDANGEILRVGWLDRNDELVTAEPDAKPVAEISAGSERPVVRYPRPRPELTPDEVEGDRKRLLEWERAAWEE